jgi:hypothetical protein
VLAPKKIAAARHRLLQILALVGIFAEPQTRRIQLGAAFTFGPE